MKFLLPIIFVLLGISGYAQTTLISSDADYYMYYGSYTTNRSPLFVGVNNLIESSPYQYHFNVANININNLTGYNLGDTVLLHINLFRFRIPGLVAPGYQGPPSYTYSTSGETFDLRIVALTDIFENITTSNNPLGWYQDNFLNAPTVATISITSSGWKALDITSAFTQWHSGTLTNHGLGLVGTASSTAGITAQFYSLESGFSPYVQIIPEPHTLSLVVLGSIWLGVRRRK